MNITPQDHRVDSAQAQLDDEAKAEDRRDKQIAEVKALLDAHAFEDVYDLAEINFTDWYDDIYEHGTHAWRVDCWFNKTWKCNGVEVDTEAVATAFVDWIGD